MTIARASASAAGSTNPAHWSIVVDAQEPVNVVLRNRDLLLALLVFALYLGSVGRSWRVERRLDGWLVRHRGLRGGARLDKGARRALYHSAEARALGDRSPMLEPVMAGFFDALPARSARKHSDWTRPACVFTHPNGEDYKPKASRERESRSLSIRIITCGN